MTTVRHICEQALSKIGAYSAADDGADPHQLAIAARWFNDLVKHMNATSRRSWLVSSPVRVKLEPGRSTYSLIRQNLSSQRNETLATEQNEAIRVDELPDPGIMFVISARRRDIASGRETGVKLIDRYQYDEITDKAREGNVECIHVDQLNEMSMRVHPVPKDATQEIILTCQRLTFDQGATEGRRETRAEIMNGFELWAIHALAALIGDGPVTRLPDSDVTRLEGRATRYMADLQAFANQEAERHAQTVYNDLG